MSLEAAISPTGRLQIEPAPDAAPSVDERAGRRISG